MDILNETHIKYLMTLPFDRDNNNLTVFFERMKSFDPLEQMAILGVTYAAFGIDGSGSNDDEERHCIKMFQEFETRCDQLAETTILEFLLMYAIVSFTLALLRSRADAFVGADNVRYMKGAIEFFRQRMAQGITDKTTAESCMRMAEARANNAMADVELNKVRYERFCSDVVQYLL